EQTHERMREVFHSSGGPWQREYMPRTTMIYLHKNSSTAKEMAKQAWENYWRAMEGTLDPKKVADAVKNTVAGDAVEVAEVIKQKYHANDRLMMWFDFNLHDNNLIQDSMKIFMEKVAPKI